MAAGSPSYRAMGERVHFSHTALSKAASGQRLPTLEVTLAYVRACGSDDESEWRVRWATAAKRLRAQLSFGPTLRRRPIRGCPVINQDLRHGPIGVSAG